MRLVSPVEGRLQRFGKWLEYDNWLNNTAPAALRVGRSAALATIPMGESVDLPINVHNWSGVAQSGTVSLALPANFTAAVTSKPYGPLAAGRRRHGDLHGDQHRHDDPVAADGDDHLDDDQQRADAGHRGDRHVDPAQDDDRAGAGDPDAGRRRPPRRVRRLADRHRAHLGGRRELSRGRLRHRLRHLRRRRRARRRRTPARRGATTRCTCTSASATSSRATRSSPRSASATGWRTRSRSSSTRAAARPTTRWTPPTRSSSGSSRSPTTRRTPTATAPTGRAGRVTRTTSRASRPGRCRLGNAPGVQVVLERDLGRLERDDHQPRLSGRDRRLHARGQAPDGQLPDGRRPGAHGPEHHALRQRQHGGRGLDDAAPHRQQRPPRVVDVRQRAVRPVPLGPRDAAGLHAAGGPPDDAAHADARGPARQRRLAADDRPVGPQRRADLRSRPGSRLAWDHGHRRQPGRR